VRDASRRARVATLITGLGRGGAEIAVLRLLTATSGEFEHMVISLRGGGDLGSEYRRAGIRVVELGLSGWIASPRRLWALRRLMSDFEPDVVTAQMYHAALAGVVARRLAGRAAPLFWTIHHSLNSMGSESRSTRLALRACRALSSAPTTIVYVSERSAQQHVDRGFPAGKSAVIPNGYDLGLLRFDNEARRRLRGEWGFADDAIVVGHIARVHPMKDHANMIAAFERAAASDDRLRLIMCGAGTQGLALPDSIEPRVHRLGPRDDVAQVMSACDIGCLSSSFGEAFPNVLAEFMAGERPCVATDVGDTAAIIDEFGTTVPPNNSGALAAALLAVARSGPAQRATLGRAARQSILERFGMDWVAARHAALWRTAIHEPAQ
jgi:glycosyltransferase involved in cell wall biosynthesis